MFRRSDEYRARFLVSSSKADTDLNYTQCKSYIYISFQRNLYCIPHLVVTESRFDPDCHESIAITIDLHRIRHILSSYPDLELDERVQQAYLSSSEFETGNMRGVLY